MYTLNFHLARYQLQHCDISLNTDTLTSLPVVFSGLKQVRDLGSDSATQAPAPHGTQKFEL